MWNHRSSAPPGPLPKKEKKSKKSNAILYPLCYELNSRMQEVSEVDAEGHNHNRVCTAECELCENGLYWATLTT